MNRTQAAVRRLPKISALYSQSEVAAFELNDATHLMQSRAHSLGDTVAQSLIACGVPCRFGGRTAAARLQLTGRKIGKVCRDNGCLLLVVAAVEDMADRVPHPLGRLDRAQLVEHQDLSLKNRPQDFQLCGLDARVVRVLDFLEQLAIV